MEVFEIIKKLENNNIFLTGPGGAGKSYLTEQIIHQYKKERKEVIVLGSTGIAAANIGGQTIHSFLKIGRCQSIQEYQKYIETTDAKIVMGMRKKLDSIIPFIKLIVIDEISMVSGDLLDLIEYVLDYHYFEGKILVVGDFFQLPPVTKNNEIKKFAFESESWNNRFKFETILLNKIHRTKDVNFIEILNNIRLGNISENVIEYLNDLKNNKDKVKNNYPTILCSTNSEVKKYNKIKLDELKFNTHIYKWNLISNNTGKTDEERLWWKNKNNKKIVNFCNSLIAEEVLELKVGASIIFLSNGDRWYNGEKGKIIEIKETLKYKDKTDIDYLKGINDEFVEEIIVIEKLNGEIVEVYKTKWDLVEYFGSSPNIEKEVIATVFQYPIKLAYAITIHKSQGMSIDNLICDVNNIFEEHQFYVSISRAINPNNLYLHYKGDLKTHIPTICKINNKVINFYNNTKVYK